MVILSKYQTQNNYKPKIPIVKKIWTKAKFKKFWTATNKNYEIW